ncbi:unnamed protein product [Heligmosomoides polygyrus]|uniref:Uncharacterized protein n=1 Tax=Heligmosomoides polygyrus TaxID=6339 RepID=A0A183GBD1_HELPZ|nr:unnamed protein product [Heligmosomoides polygyrus]
MERFVVLPQVMSSRELEGDPPSQAPASAPKGKNLQLILLLLLQPPKLNHGQFRVYASAVGPGNTPGVNINWGKRLDIFVEN